MMTLLQQIDTCLSQAITECQTTHYYPHEQQLGLAHLRGTCDCQHGALYGSFQAELNETVLKHDWMILL